MTAKVKKEGVAEKQTAGANQQPLRLREAENATAYSRKSSPFFGSTVHHFTSV